MRDASLCAAAAGGGEQHEPRPAQPDRGLRPRAQQGGVGHHQRHQVACLLSRYLVFIAMSVTSILQVDNLRDPVLRALRARADRQHHQPRHPLQQVGA